MQANVADQVRVHRTRLKVFIAPQRRQIKGLTPYTLLISHIAMAVDWPFLLACPFCGGLARGRRRDFSGIPFNSKYFGKHLRLQHAAALARYAGTAGRG